MTCRVCRAERERERERGRGRREEEGEEEEGGVHNVLYALEHNDACSDAVNTVDLDSESMPGSRCRSYDGEASVTLRSNIT